MRTIGIFDSGYSGMSMIRYLSETRVRVKYFGDIQNYPYAKRPAEEVRNFAMDGINHLSYSANKPDAIAITCSYSSSALGPYLKTLEIHRGIPIISVVEAGATEAVRASTTGNIGLIGSRGTINSGYFANAINFIGGYFEKPISVFSQACPGLTKQIEEGRLYSPETRTMLETYLMPLRDNIDTIILACSHYSVLKGLIGDVLGNSITIVDPLEIAARLTLLKVFGDQDPPSGRPKIDLHFSGHINQSKLSLWQSMLEASPPPGIAVL